MTKSDIAIITTGAGIITAALVIAVIVIDAPAKPSSTLIAPKEPPYHIIKDLVTQCQYIVSGGAMYPRLDDRKTHICSDTKKYHFNPES